MLLIVNYKFVAELAYGLVRVAVTGVYVVNSIIVIVKLVLHYSMTLVPSYVV